MGNDRPDWGKFGVQMKLATISEKNQHTKYHKADLFIYLFFLAQEDRMMCKRQGNLDTFGLRGTIREF